jgi:hypothetical protein
MKYPVIIFVIYQKENVSYFSNKNAITLAKTKKGRRWIGCKLCIIGGTNISRIIRGIRRTHVN